MAKKRDLKLIKQCLERDGHKCMKCGRTDGLHAHHIWALVDGGPDELDNLITLCALCHAEWHCLDMQEMPVMPFDTWLTYPPWRYFLLALHAMSVEQKQATSVADFMFMLQYASLHHSQT